MDAFFNSRTCLRIVTVQIFLQYQSNPGTSMATLQRVSNSAHLKLCFLPEDGQKLEKNVKQDPQHYSLNSWQHKT